MNTDMDDLIRDAVRRQEQLAVDPARIRAALPARAARRRRTRTLVTVAAAVMAVVAVLVPVIAVPAPGNGSGPAVFAAPKPTAIPMSFKPAWLPDGMVEVSRSVPLTPGTTLGTAWKWESPSWQITLLSAADRPSDDGIPDETVDINGTPGRYTVGQTRAYVVWPFDENTTLWLSTTPDAPKEVLLRIARSVKPDPTRLRPPMNLGWIPDDVDGKPVLEVTRDWPSWKASIRVDNNPQRSLSVHIGTRSGPASGEAVTVNGRTAHLEPEHGWLAIDLDDGRQLLVTMSPSFMNRNEIIRVAENVQLDPNPDVAWLGR